MEEIVSFSEFRQQLLDELSGNILPFWLAHAFDETYGGFYGEVDLYGQIKNETPRTAILGTRILWTFSAAARELGDVYARAAADRMFEYFSDVLWDSILKGVYWSVDRYGTPVEDRKHHYAQAFALYSLAEYYRATGEAQALAYAQELFSVLEQFAYDPQWGGYIEGRSSNWQPLEDMRLSEKDLNCDKSMNTMLHMLEAFTNLRRVWPDNLLAIRHEGLIEVFLNHVYDPFSRHQRLFFDHRWQSLSDDVSYGHDIEASWLLWEAAEINDDPHLIQRVRPVSLALAQAVLEEGIAPDGYIVNEGVDAATIAWWPQVEGMIGFTNAYQLSGAQKYWQPVLPLWRFIQNKMIDHKNGGWFKKLHLDGTPDARIGKIGPWEGPYHHARGCLEMAARLKQLSLAQSNGQAAKNKDIEKS